MKNLHFFFVSSLVALTLWLLIRPVLDDLYRDRAETADPHQEKPLILQVFRKNLPYYKFHLNKGTYRIGAEGDCAIILKGQDIPQRIGEIMVREGQCILINLDNVAVFINTELAGKGERILNDHCEIVLGDYCLTIDKQADSEVKDGK